MTLSPKTYADEDERREQELDVLIIMLEEQLRSAFENAKAAADFVLLATSQVVVSGVFLLVLEGLKQSDWTTWTLKPVLGLIATGLLAFYLISRNGRIVELFVHLNVSKAQRAMGLAFDYERNAVANAFWRGLLLSLQIAAIWGVLYAAQELGKASFGK
jgi:hypothetical protein